MGFFREENYQNIIGREILAKILGNTFRHTTIDGFAAMLTTPVDAVIEFGRLCQDQNAGGRISLLFNPHRLDVGTPRAPSIFKSLKDEKFLSGLARAMLFRERQLDTDYLLRSIAIGVNSTQYICEFPPYVARHVYKLAKVPNPVILDPCSGWGGRMIGAASLGGLYHGHDPSTKTYEGLKKLGHWLKQFDTGFKFRVRCIPFEEAELEDGKYDIALTSPPYFNTELYSDEETNSCVRYNSGYKDWEEGFYIPMIKKTLKALKPSGFFVLNISSRKYPLEESMKKVCPKAERLDVSLAGSNGGFKKKPKDREMFFLLRRG